MWSNPRVPFQLSSERKRLEPPGGKPIICNIVMNIEYWPFDRAMPRGILPPPHGVQIEPPDVPNFAWVEYGMRCGMPRIMAMLEARKLRASAFTNAQVADVYPSLMAAVVAADWELVGHGWFQRSLKQVDDEAAEISKCLARLEAAGGKRPRAWLGAGMGETFDTPDHLRAHGIEFLHDFVMDDLPFWIRTKHGPLVGLPYTFELNDVPTYAVQHSSSDEMLNRLKATLSVFEREGRDNPRVLTFGLHPHIIGVPHIAYYFEKALDIMVARDDVTFMTSSEIGDWFVTADGTGGAEVAAFNDGPPV
jgi:peptidoglycan/xylan/chitin deacetylase (PgdA/CDA1 family)